MSTKHQWQKTQAEDDHDSDDEFDELDDILGEFDQLAKSVPSGLPPTTTTTTTTTTKVQTTATSHRPRNNTRVDALPISIPGSGPELLVTEEQQQDLNENQLQDDFARELAKGMEELMKGITNDIATGSSSSDTPLGSDREMTDQERAQAIKSAWEAMLMDGMNSTNDPSLGEDARPKTTGSGNIPTPTNDFQTRIQQTMNKLKESESDLRPDSTNGSSATPGEIPESFQALLKSLDSFGLGENEDDAAEFTNLLENMMGQLTSKEILYEPLKELATNFPEYLAKLPESIDTADRKRYEQQYACIKQVIAVFEKPDYSDTNPQDSQTIVELMTKVQTYGQPPSELLQDLPPGFDGKLAQAGDDCAVA